MLVAYLYLSRKPSYYVMNGVGMEVKWVRDALEAGAVACGRLYRAILIKMASIGSV